MANVPTEINGLRISKISDDGEKVRFNFDITWCDAERGTIFVALYNDNHTFIGMNYSTINGPYEFLTVNYTTKPKYYRVFMWNNPEEMVALSNICEGTF